MLSSHATHPSAGLYAPPSLKVLGELRSLTLGGKHSCHDGNSGNIGNLGTGNCNGTSAGS